MTGIPSKETIERLRSQYRRTPSTMEDSDDLPADPFERAAFIYSLLRTEDNEDGFNS